jgi:hypothetical protein
MLLKHGLDFKGKKISMKFKLIPDLLGFWLIFGKDYGWCYNKKFCPCCNQKCDKDLLGVKSGIK